MKVVFMGTPKFALPCLKKIIEEKYDVVAVVTKSDKPKGRGNKLAITPIKEYAIKKDIRIMQPEDVSSEEFKEQLSKLNADVFITCAYGKILPEDILNMTKYGCINVHASLLPK